MLVICDLSLGYLLWSNDDNNEKKKKKKGWVVIVISEIFEKETSLGREENELAGSLHSGTTGVLRRCV